MTPKQTRDKKTAPKNGKQAKEKAAFLTGKAAEAKAEWEEKMRVLKETEAHATLAEKAAKTAADKAAAAAKEITDHANEAAIHAAEVAEKARLLRVAEEAEAKRKGWFA